MPDGHILWGRTFRGAVQIDVATLVLFPILAPMAAPMILTLSSPHSPGFSQTLFTRNHPLHQVVFRAGNMEIAGSQLFLQMLHGEAG